MCLRKDLIAFSDISWNESTITEKYRPLLLGIVRYFLLSTPTPTGALEMLMSVRPELLISISSSLFFLVKNSGNLTRKAATARLCYFYKCLTALNFRRTSGREDPGASSSLQRPQVRCESQLVAEYASYTINTAKSQWEELRQTLPPEESID